ncbi:thioesterase family protein [Gephyromycinifex aptenodytis]|uniref:thioesterase family protein n=1 Tax=Gephyromycinifex aptenodytis TaxID=2716227 RepID=UPI001D0128B5|nr:thioesterase family protein [Gephyromycinifex aptenodytis]
MTTLPDGVPDPGELDADSGSYYRRLDEHTYQPTLHAQGAWQPFEQHMAPVSGLIAHCLETFNGREDMQLSRVTYEILGMIPAAPSTIQCRTIRPGRTIELDEAVMSVNGRDVVRATGWRLSKQDTSSVSGGFPQPLPDPQTFPVWDGTRLWGGGYIASLDFRADPDSVPGSGRMWIKPRKSLIENTPASDLASYIGIVDTANGVATREHPGEWMFPNLDLTIHMFRAPSAGWVGFDTDVVFGHSGVGLTSSVLYDVHGAVGRAEQILTVRQIPSSAG